jgi:hypothetical protein
MSTTTDILKNSPFNVKIIIGKGTFKEQVSFYCHCSHTVVELINKVKEQSNTIHPDFDWTDFCKNNNLLKINIWNSFLTKGYKQLDSITFIGNEYVSITYFEYFNIFCFLAKKANVIVTQIKIDGGTIVVGGAGLF